VVAYPCPACGGVADETSGCRRCGRPHDPDAAELAAVNRQLAALEHGAAAGDATPDEIVRLRTRADALRATLLRKLTIEAGLAPPAESGRSGERGATAASATSAAHPTTAGPEPAARPGPVVTEEAPAVPVQPSGGRPAGAPPRAGATTTPRAGATTAPPRQRDASPGSPPTADHAPETSPRSNQNTLLTLGGVLVGIAAVVLTGIFYSTAASGWRTAILGLATIACLTVPLALTRRTLTATAETIAAVGLLAVLLDGYVARNGNAGLRSLSITLFSAILCGLVAAVAAAYRFASHLRAPQFFALLAVQPFLPLLGPSLNLDGDGYGVVFALVALLNLAAVQLLGRDVGWLFTRLRLARAARTPWPRLLRELAWVLYGAMLATSVVLAVLGIARAATVAEAMSSGLVLLLAAGIGVVGALLSGRDWLGRVATGAATLAVIGAFSQVSALALPDVTLVLTAALAAVIALAASALPAHLRAGPRWGSLAGAVLAAGAVLVTVARSTVVTVRAAVDPRIWDADLSGYAQRVHTGDWQVPVAALLLTIIGVVAAGPPPRERRGGPHPGWRVDALVVGLAVLALALPGTGALPFWAVPASAWAVSTLATASALAARTPAAAAIRASTAGLLGLVAVVTGLARPALTAMVCTLLVLVAVGTAVLGAVDRGWLGPYAPRVVDATTGVGAFALPVAVGTIAYLAHIDGSILVPLTLLATATGVAAASIAQPGAGTAHTGSMAGALGASAGGLLVALRVAGGQPVDRGIAVLLVVAALAGLAHRIAGSPTLPSTVDLPGAGVPVRGGRSSLLSTVDGRTAGAALATAAVILALARLGAVAVPGIGLVVTTTMVLLVSLTARLLPRDRQLGPRLGSGAVGAVVIVSTAAVALLEAGHAVLASTPFWKADPATWAARLDGPEPFGVSVPACLLLAGLAAWAILPSPVGGEVAYLATCLAGLSVPAVLDTPWWSAPVLALVLATLAGVGAALVGPADGPGAHRRRLVLAAVLAADAVAVGSPTPAGSAVVLAGLLVAAVIVATVARVRDTAPVSVPGSAAAAGIVAAAGAAVSLAAAGDTGRTGLLAAGLAVAAIGVPVVTALRVAGARWGGFPAVGVGVAALGVAVGAAFPDPTRAGLWAAGAALVATAATWITRPFYPDDDLRHPRVPAVTLAATAVPAGLLAAVVSTPAWLSALGGPLRTVRHPWQDVAVTGGPRPAQAATAMLTLLLLAGVCGGIAQTLGGRKYLLAAVVPPLAAATVVLPAALGAPREVMPWVALAVALATGLGAALWPPSLPRAAHLLRASAGIVCLLTGAAGFAGSLARPATTIAALAVVAAAALVAAVYGRDPQARRVAWIVFAGAGFALPPVILAATGQDLRPAAFGMLAVCAVLVGIGWLLARAPSRHADATEVELAAAVGAVASIVVTLGSIRHTAAVLFVCGLLLGVAALRRDRSDAWRDWLVRSALGTELAACWILLYAVHIGLPEAYTLPFAALALLAGVLELRWRPELNSWLAYGPALAGAFLPSMTLILVGDGPVWRWVGVLLLAVGTVLVGTWRGRRAPVIVGGVTAVAVALVEMIWLLVKGIYGGALFVAAAGVVLIVFGAFAERRLRETRPTPATRADRPASDPPTG